MPRRVSASTARPAAATATATTASSSSTTTTMVANSTTAEESSATAGPSSSKSLPLSPAQAVYSSATLASASASTSKLGDGTQASASRPRRIMPSRSRRGGPGVGISDVDTHILETLRRRRAFPSPPSSPHPPSLAVPLDGYSRAALPLPPPSYQSFPNCVFFLNGRLLFCSCRRK